nr:MAG TPA: hypothetical protein [Caudoviricetes sp.]
MVKSEKLWYRKDVKRKLEGSKPKNPLVVMYEIRFRGVTVEELRSILGVKLCRAQAILDLDRLPDAKQTERLKRYLDEGN